jgi:replicative DNA helicase
VELALIPAVLDALVDEVMLMASISFDHAAEVLYKHWVERMVARITSINLDSPVETAKTMQEELGKVLLKRSGKKYNHREEIIRLNETVQQVNTKKEGQLYGYSTGLKSLDDATGGIKPGNFYVMGALKKTGKSRFMVYLAIQLMKQLAGVINNSLEMSEFQLNTLLTAHYTGIDSSAFDRRFNREEFEKYGKGMNDVLKTEWLIYRDYTIPELRSRVISERQNRDVKVVFVDFLQRMRPTNFIKDRTRGIEEIAMGLADLSKDLNIAVIALAQLSGVAEDLPASEIPQMKYFKESQGIVENADSIWVLHNPKRGMNQAIYEPTEFLMRVDQRYGQSGVVTGMVGDLRTCTYTDMDRDRVRTVIESAQERSQKTKNGKDRVWQEKF